MNNEKPVPRALLAAAKFMRGAAKERDEARADAVAFADVVRHCHSQAIDARALIEANRWEEVRAVLDNLIGGLDRLVESQIDNSDISEK